MLMPFIIGIQELCSGKDYWRVCYESGGMERKTSN